MASDLVVCGIDPGIDRCAWAILEQTTDNPLDGLRTVGHVDTSSRSRIEVRVRRIIAALMQAWQQYDVTHVIIEIPARGVVAYNRDRAIVAQLDKVWLVIGAVIAAAHVARLDVETLRADTRPKAERQRHLEAMARSRILPLYGPRGGLVEDRADALWLAVRAVLARQNPQQPA